MLENVFLDLDWGVAEERLESLEMGALGEDGLQGALGLCLEVIGGGLVDHTGKEVTKDISFSEGAGVVGCVATNLAKGPGRGGLDVILRLCDQGLAEGHDSLGDNDGEGEGLGEGSDVSHGHDTGELGVALGFADIVDEGGSSAGVDDELGELGCVLSNLPDASSGVLANEGIVVLEAVEDVREDLGLDDDLGEVNGMLGDLGEARADLAL